jgi:peptide/nickel transport system permease protein
MDASPGAERATRPPGEATRRQRPRVTMPWLAWIGGGTLALIVAASLLAPWLGTIDPNRLDAAHINLLPGATGRVPARPGTTGDHRYLMGTDSFGRDVYSRALYGGRVSLIVGASVGVLSLLMGSVIGLGAGYMRRVDGVVMRVMDGITAIPGILLALALVAIWRASLGTLIAAITIPEIPRVARVVRSQLLSIREELYVEAALCVGTRTVPLLYRHVLPNIVAPLIVQGAYVCAVAILSEATLGFLGVGLPTDVPTWGNIMAEGRQDFYSYPHKVLLPGILLALTVLSVNMLGDGLRDAGDPRFAKGAGRS